MNTESTREYLLGRQGEILKEMNEIERDMKGEGDAEELTIYHASLAALYARLHEIESVLADLVEPAV